MQGNKKQVEPEYDSEENQDDDDSIDSEEEAILKAKLKAIKAKKKYVSGEIR